MSLLLPGAFLTFGNRLTVHPLCVRSFAPVYIRENEGAKRGSSLPRVTQPGKSQSQILTLMWLIPKLLLLFFGPCHVKGLWLVSLGG